MYSSYECSFRAAGMIRSEQEGAESIITCSAPPVGVILESLRGSGALPLPPAGTKAMETLLFWALVVTDDRVLSAAASPANKIKVEIARQIIFDVYSQYSTASRRRESR